MPKVKEFDCVRMKDEIQRALEERHQGMTDQEIAADEERRILSSPILGPLYRDLKREEPERV